MVSRQYAGLVTHHAQLDGQRFDDALAAHADFKALTRTLLAPGRYERSWTSLHPIADVLKTIARSGVCDVQYSWGGRQMFTGARVGAEIKTLEIDVNGARKIVRPATLTLLRPHGDVHDEFTYALLGLSSLEPSGIDDDLDGLNREELTQLKRGEYGPRDIMTYGMQGPDGWRPPPPHARVVVRVFRGSLLFVPWFSALAMCRAYRKGAHDEFAPFLFKEFIESVLRDRRGRSIFEPFGTKHSSTVATGAAT